MSGRSEAGAPDAARGSGTIEQQSKARDPGGGYDHGRRGRYRLRTAVPGDAAGMLEIYESGAFKGGISVMYTRRPDPLASLAMDGDRAVIIVAEDLETNRLIGMGACVIRRAVVDADGRIGNVGYLTGLKVLPEYRRRLPLMVDAYRMMREQTRGEVEIYYTTILEENAAVSAMFEKRRAGMPEYRFVGQYQTLFLRTGVGRRGYQSDMKSDSGRVVWKLPDGMTLERCDESDAPGCMDTVWKSSNGMDLERTPTGDAQADGLKKHWQENLQGNSHENWHENRRVNSQENQYENWQENLIRLRAAVPPMALSPENLYLKRLSGKDAYLLRDRNGEVVAGCALWNQQAWKQYIITGYAGAFRFLRHLPMQWFGYPDLPEENTVANCASFVGLAVRDNDPKLAVQLIREVATHARGYEFLMLGMCRKHPLWTVLSKLRGIRYGSRLYEVIWDEMNLNADGQDAENMAEMAETVQEERIFNLEVGFL